MAPWIVLRTPRLPVSFRLDARLPVVFISLLLVTLAAMIVNMGVGEFKIAPLDVVRTLFGVDTGVPQHVFVVMNLRLPRMLLAWLVGAALAVSGNIVQGVTRNPLASPDLTGVTAGASLAAVFFIVAVPGLPRALLPLMAFLGALAVAVLLYILAWRRGDSPMRFILVGIGLQATLSAVIGFQLTFGRIDLVTQAMMWLAGTVYATTWAEVNAVLPWIGIGLLVALVLARHLNALNLGEEVARGLGTPVTRQRAILLLVAVALAGVTVTVAGTVGFVGLVAPHLARRLVGPMHEGSQVVAALVGGALVIVSDLIGRTVIAPAEIPCGIIISLLGAPFFLYLIWKNRERF
ncbi:MAG TPA: iron ABC transporter permease [Anaerolineales bacterium]|nr:iron ABC transporter permease [Anaerolineales bacterium]HRQ92215.1 iron ABC transporter permease [Anaerolineales bacterium]